MATQLTAKQKRDFQAQIDWAAKQVAELQRQRGIKPQPKGEVAGASTSFGDFPANSDATGNPDDYAGGTFEASPETLKKTKVTPEMEQTLSERYGGKSGRGTSGRSLYDADKIARQRAQISGSVGYSFNNESMKRTQRAVDKFGFALDEADNNPFEPKKYKEDNKNNLLEVTSRELGQLFTSADEIYDTYKFNQQFKSTVDKFIKKGGTLEGIAKNVSTPVVRPPHETRVNADGTTEYVYPDGTSEVEGGPNIQSPSEYLGSLRNPQANQEAEKMALEELSPETDIAQAEIMRQAKVPQELKALYFGDEKSIGIVSMRRQQAEEESRVLAEKEKDAKRTARDKANLQIERNKADTRVASAKIEENRLAAKNYMTSKLASLGALQTTGAAVLALQTLETKYQGMVANLEVDLKFRNRGIEIDLNEDINNIENTTDDKILTIQEDLTKDSETIAKEVLKAQNDAEKETYRITEQHGRRLRERTSKFTADLKAAAEKYAKAYAKTAGGGLDFTSTGTVTSKSKLVNTIEKTLEASRGSDTYVNSEAYAKAYKDWIAKGGTARTFIATFPPKAYANPNDTSLPVNLQYARESQTVKADANDDDLKAQIDAMFADDE